MQLNQRESDKRDKLMKLISLFFLGGTKAKLTLVEKKTWPIKTTTTTAKLFVANIWGRLYEPEENYVGSGT